MSIFDEQILEPFVNRGVGNSGVASRQVRATNLPDLAAAIRESQLTQKNLEDQRASALKASALANIDSNRRVSVRDASAQPSDFGAYITQDSGGKFYLTSRSSSNSLENKEFGDLTSLQNYVKSNPYLKNTQVVYTGGSGMTEGVLKQLASIGRMVSPLELADIKKIIFGGSGEGAQRMMAGIQGKILNDRGITNESQSRLPASEQERINLKNLAADRSF